MEGGWAPKQVLKILVRISTLFCEGKVQLCSHLDGLLSQLVLITTGYISQSAEHATLSCLKLD